MPSSRWLCRRPWSAQRTLRRWWPCLFVAAQVGGCLPDNAIRSVFSDQLLQTFTIGTSGLTSLIFGFPDLILNSLVFNALSSLTGS